MVLASTALLSVCGTSCVSCAPAKPTLSVKGATIANADLDGATIDVEVEVDNPNGFAIFVDEVLFTASLEKQRVATGALKQRVTVDARNKARAKIPVRLRYADVGALLQAMNGRDTWRYDVTGEVALNPIDAVSLRLPFATDGVIDAPRLPRITAKRGRVSDISLRAVTVEVDVAIANDNAFDIPAGSFVGAVRLGGEEASRVNVVVPKIGARQTVTVVVHDKITGASLARSGAALVAGRAVNATVDGTFAWSTRRQSFKATLPLSR